ncbi:MAG TPA: PDDEXK nuclease domain-containing protein [Puia sp.]|nr:PDDEXK nuclease domain-containing protein [Puia sp.]
MKIGGMSELVLAIGKANQFFRDQAQRQVNTSLTLRNWIIGFYIVEYEQNGKDRAEYGEKLIRMISERLRDAGIKGLSYRSLQLFKQFYITYPQLAQEVKSRYQTIDYQFSGIVQTVSAQLEDGFVSKLLSKLSFSHFIELMRADTRLKQVFYETEAMVNNWSVRELQRAIDSMLFERTGLSKDKEAVLEKHRKGTGLKPDDIFRSPYMLDFLGLEEKPAYVETDLEGAIIAHLQAFLLEMGRGFCFEARQKRITFDNTHYRIDLVFYHRLLRCHVLIDLKMGKFTPADAGQMHMYLNYFAENEAGEGDNPPIGIILCADKSETLVKYATAGLPQPIFVSKYMTNLPSERELQDIIEEERQKNISVSAK